MNGPLRILLVEDNEGDIDLLRIAFEEEQMLVELRTAYDGLEALRALFPQCREAAAFRPDVILLDLNMPRMDGLACLEALRRRKKTKHIPVFILTSSAAQDDILKGYRCGASCYITKPASLDEYIALAKKIETFWLQVRVSSERTAA
jgi:two-component system response regulator